MTLNKIEKCANVYVLMCHQNFKQTNATNAITLNIMDIDYVFFYTCIYIHMYVHKYI